MSTVSEKLEKKELPEVKRKANNPARLHMSYEEALADSRREKEKEARLKLAAAKIEAELDQEEVIVKTKKAKKKVAELNKEDIETPIE